MAEQEKKKVGLNEVNFLGLGEDTKSDEEVVIADQDEEISQEQEELEDAPPEQEDDEEQELETDDGDPPADDQPDEDGEDGPDEVEDSPDEDEDKGDDTKERFSVFESTAKNMGVELDEDDLEGIDTDDPTTDDLSKFIEKVSGKIADQRFKKTVEKYPEVEGFLEYAENGGDPRQYIETMYPQFDYNQVNYDEHVAEDEQAQEQIVRNHLVAQDTPAEEIDEMIEDFRNGGILDKQAKRSLGKLQKMQEQAQEELVEQQRKAAEEQRKKAQEQQQQIEQTIDESKSIKGLKLPKTDKDDLKKYLFEPVDEEGRSQAFIDGHEMDTEERIAIAYLKMKGFDFETLIENEAETKNAKRLRDQIKNGKKDKPSSKREREKTTAGKVQDIKPII